MYSVRDVAKSDLKSALKAVSDLGYKYVEFAGFFGNSAETVKGWLDELGLLAIGTHTGIDAIRPEAIDETIAYHNTIGARYLTVPAASWNTEEQMADNISVMNAALPKLKDAGIELGYHNHSREFYKTHYGKTVIDEIISGTNLLLEIDTFWLYNAGIDPVPYLEEHKDRIRLIHLKDGTVDKTITRTVDNPHDGAVGYSVGDGELPISDIVAWARRNNVELVIESEGLDPDGPSEVARCIKNLITIEK